VYSSNTGLQGCRNSTSIEGYRVTGVVQVYNGYRRSTGVQVYRNSTAYRATGDVLW